MFNLRRLVLNTNREKFKETYCYGINYIQNPGNQVILSQRAGTPIGKLTYVAIKIGREKVTYAVFHR